MIICKLDLVFVVQASAYVKTAGTVSPFVLIGPVYKAAAYLSHTPRLLSSFFCFLHIIRDQEVVKDCARFYLRNGLKTLNCCFAFTIKNTTQKMTLLSPAKDQDRSHQCCQTCRYWNRESIQGCQFQDAPRLLCSWGCQSAWVSILPEIQKTFIRQKKKH